MKLVNLSVLFKCPLINVYKVESMFFSFAYKKVHPEMNSFDIDQFDDFVKSDIKHIK